MKEQLAVHKTRRVEMTKLVISRLTVTKHLMTLRHQVFRCSLNPSDGFLPTSILSSHDANCPLKVKGCIVS